MLLATMAAPVHADIVVDGRLLRRDNQDENSATI
jgi:hypothetical protein